MALEMLELTIVGVGLLGGSIGLGLKSANLSVRITGLGHRRETLERAVEFGAIDRWTLDPAEAVRTADLVILCTPVSLFESMFRQIARSLRAGAVVTDVGSTKRTVVKLAERILPEHARFVGSHPMAGSEKRGVEYARADLFANATCIITPTAGTDAQAMSRVEQIWKHLGMRLVHLSPEEHDAAVSDISHLPHVLAAALISMQSREAMPLVGKGFLDTTRVASGDAQLWRDILLDNRDNLRASMERLEKEISLLRRLLSPSRAEALTQWLASAARRRDELVMEKLKEVSGG